ncbi:MAG: substrate-binding domain-containing protein [Rhizobiales bacterium]|nr:substrate-binding domain-containing protein [Hyphomicrobiales bacterium]
MLTRRLFLSALSVLPATRALAQEEEPRPLRLALIVARAGDDYFVSCREGALQAAAEVAGSQLTFIAPPAEEAERQAALVDDFSQQGYDGILIAPIPSDVVIAACQRAIARGLRVISFGTALPPDARHLHLRTPDISDAAPVLLQTISNALGKAGEIAVVSTAPERADHQAFVKALQREWNKPDYDDLVLITTVFGNEDVRASYAQVLAVVQAYPKLRGIVAPDAAALMGAARAVKDLGKSQSIKLTGIGLPSRLAGMVREGEVPAFVTWSPIDVGYAAARIALSVLRNEEAIVGDAPLKVGKLGELVVDKGGVARVGSLVTVDQANIDTFDDKF